jgi:dTDP-glucose 4,6-dehydratase
MKILITGGAGFMGSHFVKHVLSKYPDYQVIVLDKLTYAGNMDNLKEIEGSKNFSFIKGDIANKEDVEKAIGNGVGKIINFAAETHVDRSILEPDAFIKTDIFGTYNILEATRKFNIGQFVQISTDEVYGSISEGSFTEESPFLPNSPYSASKAGGDLLCRAYFETYKTPVIVTHSCNFYGPNQYPEKLIPLFITNLIEGKKVPVYAKGENVREWIYTSDYCRAIDLIMEKGANGEVYNIGTGNERKNIEVTKFILDVMGFGEEIIEYVKDRPGHDFRYSINCEKLRKLGWQPEISFEDGLRETIGWYKDNSWWWKKIKSGEYLEYYKKQYLER